MGTNATATVLAVLWCSFTHGLCEAAGAACAASSSKGANAWPVMSGVTRPWFQNTAVNKVKVSPFAGKEVCFYELDSTWMKSFSKQTSRLYAWVFFSFWIKKKQIIQMSFVTGYIIKITFSVFNK